MTITESSEDLQSNKLARMVLVGCIPYKKQTEHDDLSREENTLIADCQRYYSMEESPVSISIRAQCTSAAIRAITI